MDFEKKPSPWMELQLQVLVSKELERSESKENQEEEETFDVFGKDFHHLFQTEEKQLIGKAKESLSTPIDKKENP